MKVTLDDVCYTSKPCGPEMAKISSRMVSAHDLTLEELRDKVTAGQTFCPAVFDGARKNDNFQQCQLLVLDFDEGISPDEVLTRCEQFGLPPVMGYYTFSHHPGAPRFRKLWALEKPLGDKASFDVVQLALMGFLPESDRRCKDAARMHLGTTKGCFYFDSESKVTPRQVLDAFCAYTLQRDRSNFARAMKSYATSVRLPLVDGIPVLRYSSAPGSDESSTGFDSGQYEGDGSQVTPATAATTNENNAGSILYIIDLAPDSSAATCEQQGDQRSSGTGKADDQCRGDRSRGRDRNFNFEVLEQNCQLYRELIAGQPLDHNATFGLLTNLLRVEGGESRFQEGLEKRDEWAEDYYRAKWDYQVRMTKSYGYQPQRCNNYCPYCFACAHKLNALQQVPKLHGVRRIEPEVNAKSVETAYTEMVDIILKALSSIDSHVYIVKAPTGIGKTRAIESLQGVLIAVPTNKLARQLAERMRKVGNDVLLVPDIEGIDDSLRREIDALYRVGAHTEARRILQVHYLKAKDKNKPTKAERALIEHVETLDELKKTTKSVIITHKRLLHMREIHHRAVIVDEDIIQAAVEIGKCSLRDLLYLQNEAMIVGDAELEGDITAVVSEIVAARDSRKHIICPMTTPVISDTRKLVRFVVERAGKLKSDVVSLFGCDYWVVDGDRGEEEVHFVRRPRLPACKLIILSATADKRIYKLAFADCDVHFHDIGRVKHEGKVIQYWTKSFAKHDLRKPATKKALARVADVIGSIPVITHAEMQSSNVLNVLPDIYFWNLRGYDDLKKQDIAVVGTPHLPPMAYALTAVALGCKPRTGDFCKMTPQVVCRNGFEFTIPTYSDDPDLQAIQLWLIESELIQAVGRARALRYDCTVYLFSNFPVPGVELRKLPKEQQLSHIKCGRDTDLATTPSTACLCASRTRNCS